MDQSAELSFTLAGKRVWVAGHCGMVGSALVRRLEREACTVLTAGRSALDLRRQADVEAWLLENRPELDFHRRRHRGGHSR